MKFPHAERHQVFLEPEGLDTTEMYVNGLSTSLPAAVQLQFLRTIPGLGNVRMTRAGYAIEYDYFPPTQLHPTLESRTLPGLFFAGQVNGTTGYEEAAAQGVVAGLNAAARAKDLEPIVLRRSQAFLGLLVDDLVNRGVDEPYRLFTSRSEFRLLLRQDNALRRLLPIAERLGLLSDEELRLADGRLKEEDRLQTIAKSTNVEPADVNPSLAKVGSSPVREATRISELARRPGMTLSTLFSVAGIECAEETAASVEVELKYAGYVAREQSAADRVARMEDVELPTDLMYADLKSLSTEAREKLAAVRPRSLGQASRIPGVSPSDIQNVLASLLRRTRRPVSRETGE